VLRARTEHDPEARSRLFREVEAIVLRDAVGIPLFHGRGAYLVKPYVKGWQPTSWPVPILKYVTIEH
jgi:ABC-type transport system substrate-binding protein